jgi:hypothetical protein
MADVELRRDIPQAERDAMDPADFAGKEDSFPINRPEDVAAAAASIGRAGPDNYSTDELKTRIIGIAKRKGPAFVAQLPQAWQDGDGTGDGNGDGDGDGERARQLTATEYAFAARGVPVSAQERGGRFAPGSGAARTLNAVTGGRRGR